MRIHRIVGAEDADNPFCGDHCKGGGRWTSPGVHCAYASGSPGSALLECLAHGSHRDRTLVLATARLPRDSVETLEDLPEGWLARPYSPEVRAVGDAWAAAGRSLALRVPSALISGEFNLLVNPEHPWFTKIVVESVEGIAIDPRFEGEDDDGERTDASGAEDEAGS